MFHKLVDIECMSLFLDPERCRSANGVRFNVVIMYEDPDTRKRAKKGLNYVAEQFGSDFEIRHWMWRLDILQDPKLSVRAALSLAKSDLLMISLHGKRRLPPESANSLMSSWCKQSIIEAPLNHRARLNRAARRGEYSAAMEKEMGTTMSFPQLAKAAA